MSPVLSILILQLSDKNYAAGFHRSPGRVGTTGLAHWDNLVEKIENQRGIAENTGSHSELVMALGSELSGCSDLQTQVLPTKQVSSLQRVVCSLYLYPSILSVHHRDPRNHGLRKFCPNS